MDNLPAIGYFISGSFFLLLTLLLVINWNKKIQGFFLILACVLSSLWSFVLFYQILEHAFSTQLIWTVEISRSISWLLFLTVVLWEVFDSGSKSRRWLTVLSVSYGLIALFLYIPHEVFLNADFLRFLGIDLSTDLRIVLFLTLAIIGISLIEQLFRNTSVESRWTIKYLCLGLGLGFFYDFFLYADALLFKRIDPVIWESRGAINVLVAPLVAVSARRNKDWALKVFVSKQVVFHTTGILGAGIYLLAMAMFGYYLKEYGGEYGDFFRVTFFTAALVLLFILVSSGQLRAKLKVFLNKNFFQYQYDYREEWLKLINELSLSDTQQPLADRVVKILASLIDTKQGSLWICHENKECKQVSSRHSYKVSLNQEDIDSLVTFFEKTNWVIDIEEYKYNRNLYEGLVLPDSVLDDGKTWIIVPLFFQNEVHSFILLPHSKTFQNLNWENRDMLMMAGRQAASYMVLDHSANQLAEARQFEGFNRLSAFVIHDLKNLIAQLSLVASNAARHKHNPEFIDDAITTIENSVGKMNKLMLQLKTAGSQERQKTADLVQIVTSVVKEKSRQKPVPQFTNTTSESIAVTAEIERLSAVIGHVIQNAQDATPDSGEITVNLTRMTSDVLLTVIDNGMGMDPDFIKNRLFKPFDTTKGLTGMGIGAYESKEFIESMGGEVTVESEPGQGTTFRIKIPVVN